MQIIKYSWLLALLLAGGAAGYWFFLRPADLVVAAESSYFLLAFRRIGLVPDCGATYTLPRVVGPQRARELFLSAREVGAAEALALGIAHVEAGPLVRSSYHAEGQAQLIRRLQQSHGRVGFASLAR